MYHSPKFPPLEKGEKHTKNLPPPRDEREGEEVPDLTKRGKSNALAHGPIIRVLTVVTSRKW